MKTGLRILHGFLCVLSGVCLLSLIACEEDGGSGSGGSTHTDFEPVEGVHILDLIDQGKLEAEASGSGLDGIQIRARNLDSVTVNVEIPAGTYFEAANRSVQNMIALKDKQIYLSSGAEREVEVPAACANRTRDVPASEDLFEILREAIQNGLQQLAEICAENNDDTDVCQAAVWIVTDNANYEDLGVLVSGYSFSRAVDEDDAVRAMQRCDEAGIDITRKAIWRDRQMLLTNVESTALHDWLENKMQGE